MKFLIRVFDFYLDASIHVALAVYCFMRAFTFFLDIPMDTNLLGGVFFGTIVCYNFIKYGVEAEKYIVVTNKYQRYIQALSFVAGGFGLYYAYSFPPQVWAGIAILSIYTIIYAIPVFSKTKNLRSLGGLKTFMVALVWSGTIVGLPFINAKLDMGYWDLFINALQCFLWVFVLLIPFEIRDLSADVPELVTLPRLLGIKKTRLLGAVATGFSFFLTFWVDTLSMEAIFLKGILSVSLIFILYKTPKVQSKYFAAFWIESIPIFWWILIFIFTKAY